MACRVWPMAGGGVVSRARVRGLTGLLAAEHYGEIAYGLWRLAGGRIQEPESRMQSLPLS
jgi:hypothetical protein